MSQTTKDITESQQSRAYAGYYGLWMGTCWIVSFALVMVGLTEPLAGDLGLLAGLCSVPLGVWLLRGFREHIAPLPLGRAWHMSWLMFLAAALLTTAAQYIYFAYIDGGLLMRTYSEMMQQPEIHDMMQQMLPGQDVDTLMNEAMTTFATTPPSQLAIHFLLWNSLIGTFFAFPTALFSFTRPKPNK